MAYNDTPLPTDLISDSQPKIRENFQLLEDSQVVDEGSTADGDYIRYENGWQICIVQKNIDLSSLDENKRFSVVGGDADINWPVSFDSRPFFVSWAGQDFPATGDDYSDVFSGIWVESRDSNRCHICGKTTTSREEYILFGAIGRWK